MAQPMFVSCEGLGAGRALVYPARYTGIEGDDGHAVKGFGKSHAWMGRRRDKTDDQKVTVRKMVCRREDVRGQKDWGDQDCKKVGQ